MEIIGKFGKISSRFHGAIVWNSVRKRHINSNTTQAVFIDTTRKLSQFDRYASDIVIGIVILLGRSW